LLVTDAPDSCSCFVTHGSPENGTAPTSALTNREPRITNSRGPAYQWSRRRTSGIFTTHVQKGQGLAALVGSLSHRRDRVSRVRGAIVDRKSTRLNSSHVKISY